MKYLLLPLIALFIISSLFGQNVNFEWVKTIDRNSLGYGREEYLMAIDGSKNIYFAGNFRNTLDLDPGPGIYNVSTPFLTDIYVVKLDPNGNFIWGKQIGGSRFDECYGFAVDPAGNVHLSGYFDSPDADFDPGPGVYNLNPPADKSAFVCKLDTDGNLTWVKQFDGPYTDLNWSLALDKSGNVLTTGFIQGKVDLNPGTAVFYLPEDNTGGAHTYVSKLDKDGNFVWAKVFKGEGSGGGCGWYLKTDDYNNVYITGEFYGGMDFDPGPAKYILGDATNNQNRFLVKLNSSGNLIWAKMNAGGSTFVVDKNQNIYEYSAFVNRGDHGFMKKRDVNGDLVWSKQTGSRDASNKYSSLMYVDGQGAIYKTGTFENTQDFDPGPGVYNMSTLFGGYDSDLAISKMDSDGNLIWVKQISGIGATSPYSVVVDADGGIYMAGCFFGKSDFDPGPGEYSLLARSGGTFFIHKMNQCLSRTDTIINASTCYNYTLNGKIYDSSGIYTQYLTNVAGCDSVISLQLTITGSETTNTVKTCDNYFWEGQIYSATGFYTVTFPIANGCDSIRHLDLTIGHNSSTTITQTFCDWIIDYEGYSTSGVYIDSFKSVTGCDSVRTLYLTFKPPSISTTFASICPGDNFWGYTESGTYQDLFLTTEGCDSTRILHLTVNSTSTSTQNITICQGESWLAGGIYQTTAGTYTDVLMNSTGCDSIVITNLVVLSAPVVDLGPDRDLCAGTTLKLEPGVFNSYLWQEQSLQPTFVVDKAGTYSVTVSASNGCTASDAIIINNILPAPSNFLSPTDSICENSPIQLSATGNFNSYMWSNGSANATITVSAPGVFSLTVEDFKGCKGTETIRIIQQNCFSGLFIPSAFTPNNDQHNDLFRASVYGPVVSFRLEIFNRNGELIFRSSDPSRGWDGRFKGVDQPTSTYVWQCFYQLQGKEPRYEKGTVTLLRNK